MPDHGPFQSVDCVFKPCMRGMSVLKVDLGTTDFKQVKCTLISFEMANQAQK